MLGHSQDWEQCIVLRTVANQFTGFLEIFLNVIACDGDLTSGWSCVSCQSLEGGRLACTVDSEQSEALTIIKTKRHFLNSKDWTSTKVSVSFSETIDSDHILLR